MQNFKEKIYALIFLDPASYDPAKHGVMPYKRNPISMSLRFIANIADMLRSDHPRDAWIWTVSLIKRRNPLTMDVPWITFDAVRFMKQHLKDHQNARIFEYGCGHSTLFWVNNGAERVYSMENSPDWAAMVRDKLSDYTGLNVFEESEPYDYVHGIDRTDDQFDIVLVDGLYRRECAEVAAHRVKPGGLLVLDDSDWHWYKDFDKHVPCGWEKHVFEGFLPYTGHRSGATIWVAPLRDRMGQLHETAGKDQGKGQDRGQVLVDGHK